MKHTRGLILCLLLAHPLLSWGQTPVEATVTVTQRMIDQLRLSYLSHDVYLECDDWDAPLKGTTKIGDLALQYQFDVDPEKTIEKDCWVDHVGEPKPYPDHWIKRRIKGNNNLIRGSRKGRFSNQVLNVDFYEGISFDYPENLEFHIGVLAVTTLENQAVTLTDVILHCPQENDLMATDMPALTEEVSITKDPEVTLKFQDKLVLKADRKLRCLIKGKDSQGVPWQSTKWFVIGLNQNTGVFVGNTRLRPFGGPLALNAQGMDRTCQSISKKGGGCDAP